MVGAILRTGAEGDFRSNLHQGGTARAVRITRAERDVALKSARAFGLNLAGVDLLRSSDGPRVLEVNSSPGLEGIEQATARNLAEKLYEEIEMRVRPTPVRRREPAASG